MIEVGQKVKYDPFKAMSYSGVCEIRKTVVGVVIYVNHKRRWFTVENDGIRTTFRFTDIGQDVRIVK